ncbi:inactive serine/threonine-protein kinase bub1 [Phytophthora nicotianae]|uniref:Inactive serine/threonine-protein kinase bub1 n=1 Tax=Phytophthora nicotianae TaxID=4792 RepID=A0A0W8DWF0_PHYNI|nr:inactive serine/threonine-protein kinase bub1 [Phytophthora nicotianae]
MDAALSDRKRKADAFEWEASKENVMPLKRGRNVADLNKALRAHDSFQTKLRLEDELKAKQDAVEAYNGDDPLAAWLEYIRWLEVKMPEDTRKKFTALEKCTRELKDNPHYKNDMRYIRLWIQYADLVSNPKDIFKYLYQNKIGERVSLFYIGWAYVLETMANYPQAHKIYLKAGQKYVHLRLHSGVLSYIENAEPQDLLERKYKEFQRRMSRQWLRMTEETGANGIDEVTHRRALESLSSYGTLELNDAQRQQLHQHRASARVQRIQKANAHKPVFVVYEDPVGHSVDPFDGNGGWKKLGTMQQQDKENEMAPKSPERKPAPLATAAQTAAVSTHNGEQEDMTINTRVALEDINSMFCSPPRQPKPSVWDAKEGDPVERKLHFSVFEDSVDSVALNAQDQSQRQDINESIPKQTFQVFKDDASAEPLVGRKQDFQIFSDGAPEEPRTGKAFQVFSDDVPEEPRTGKTSWSQKRKPLGARDDLVCSVRLTNKDVLMRVQKDAAEKDSTER